MIHLAQLYLFHMTASQTTQLLSNQRLEKPFALADLTAPTMALVVSAAILVKKLGTVGMYPAGLTHAARLWGLTALDIVL